MTWTQPRCEACWFEMEGEWDGGHLVSVRQPTRVVDPFEVEQCAWCGAPTMAGIYVRANPDTVLYPKVETE